MQPCLCTVSPCRVVDASRSEVDETLLQVLTLLLITVVWGRTVALAATAHIFASSKLSSRVGPVITVLLDHPKNPQSPRTLASSLLTSFLLLAGSLSWPMLALVPQKPFRHHQTPPKHLRRNSAKR